MDTKTQHLGTGHRFIDSFLIYALIILAGLPIVNLIEQAYPPCVDYIAFLLGAIAGWRSSLYYCEHT